MDQQLKAYLEEREAWMEARMDERFARMEARMDERFAHVDERFERVGTEARHTGVLVEGVHDTVRLVAEGVIGTGERIDALRDEITGRLEEIKGSVEMIHLRRRDRRIGTSAPLAVSCRSASGNSQS